MEVIKGRKYRHFKGNIYKVIENSVIDAVAGVDVILYMSDKNNQLYTRPLDEWFSEVEDRKDNITNQKYRFMIVEE